MYNLTILYFTALAQIISFAQGNKYVNVYKAKLEGEKIQTVSVRYDILKISFIQKISTNQQVHKCANFVLVVLILILLQ